MERNPYPVDVTNEQWSLIESHIPPETPAGRPRSMKMHEVINGIHYLNRTGCSWRMLPHDLPPCGTVHYYYCRFRRAGVWSDIHDRLRGQVRIDAKRTETGFAVLPKRCIVERTFAWRGKYRRLSKDDETLPQSSESMIRVAMINLMIHRLEPR